MPLRPLGFGEVLDGAFTAVQRYPKIMVGLSALLVTGLMLVSFVVMFFGFADFFTTDDIGQLGDARIITFAVTALVLGVLFWICELALTGMITVTVSQGVLGKQVTVRQAWEAAKGRLLSLAGMMILYIVAYVVAVTVIVLLCVLLIYLTEQAGVVAIGIILTVLIAIGAILGGVYAGVRLSLTPAVLVLETRPVNPGFPGGEQRPIGLFGAMRRSWDLVQGRWWRTFGLIFVAGLIAGVLSSIVQYGFLFLAMGLGFALGAITSSENLGAVVGGLIYVIGGIGATILQLSFTSAINVLIYIDARMRGEGLDLELANLTGGDAPADTVNPWAAR